jgi:hypothetical protein
MVKKLRGGKAKPSLVIAYPGEWESQLTHKALGVPVYKFRPQQRGRDQIKGLQIFPRVDAVKQCVVYMNDVYARQAFTELFQAYAWKKDGHDQLTVVITRRSLGGSFGADIVHGEVLAVWRKEDGVTYTTTPESATQYDDVLDDSWLDQSSGLMAEGIWFDHKPEKQFGGGSTFRSTIRLTTEFRPEKPLGKPLSQLGVIVNEDGLVPLLFNRPYAMQYGSDQSEQRAQFEVAQRDLSESLGRKAFGRLLECLGGSTVYPAIACTLTKLHAERPPPPKMKSEDYVTEAARESFKLPGFLAPFSKLLSNLTVRQPVGRMLAGVAQDLGDLISSLLQKLLAWFRDREAAPANVIYNFAGVLDRVAHALSATRLGKLSVVLRRVAKAMAGSMTISETDTIFKTVLKALLITTTVVAERLVASTVPAALLVAGLDWLFAWLSTSDLNPVQRKSLLAVFSISAVGNVLLSRVPWVISLPAHVLYDVAVLGAVKRIYNHLRSRKTVKVNGAMQLLSDDSEVFAAASAPRIDIAPLLEAPLPYCTVSGQPVTASLLYSEMASTLTKPAHPLVGGPEGPLGNFVLTDSLSALVTACLMRYQNIGETPAHLFPNMDVAVEILLSHTQYSKPVVPFTREAVMDHGRGRWGKRKLNQYEKAFDSQETGKQPDGRSASVGGKSLETLKKREAPEAFQTTGELVQVYKGRIVYFGTPDIHVGKCLTINWALGTKGWLVNLLNRMEVTIHGWPVRLFVPVTGLASELEGRADAAVRRSELLVLVSGDDGQCRISGVGEFAVDLKSCDTTIQGPLQDRIFRFLSHHGVPQQVLEEIANYNAAPKTFKFGRNRQHKLRQELPMSINCSGNSFTTVITIVASAMAWLASLHQWDGQIETLCDTVEHGFRGLGLEPEFEAPPTINPVTRVCPVGSTTFLSQVFVPTECGGLRVTPAHGLKYCILKGPVAAAKGDQIGYALAARAQIPALQTRPTLKAMAECFQRLANPTFALLDYREWMIHEDPSWEYKTLHDNIECMSLLDEANYLSNYGISLDDIHREIEFWRDCQELPAAMMPPVLAKLSMYFY